MLKFKCIDGEQLQLKNEKVSDNIMNNLIIVENQLIPIYKNEEGEKLVNARELHEWLGNKGNFTTWVDDRIKQYKFIEGVDYTSFFENQKKPLGGRPNKEYTITLDMAKELSIVERTYKGKQARKYFIQVEKDYKEVIIKQLAPMEQIKLQNQTLEEHEQKLNTIDAKVALLENNMVIEYGQEVSIKKAVDKQVISQCGGFDARAYLDKDLRRKIYRSIWKDYKCCFSITSYHNTPKKDFEKALDIVATWKPFGHIRREIQIVNDPNSAFPSPIYNL